tara:strand:+ start:36 stop:239 length:204 start_codon:yes stop_codon:yes gene_type:complete
LKKTLKANKNSKNVYLLQMTTKTPLVHSIANTLNVQSLNVYLTKLNNLKEQLQVTFNLETSTALNNK